MSDKSSGVYVIDEDYNIVSCNQTILEMYPQLKKGEKCYRCLMNLDEPCPPCPVAGGVKGPQTYLDPIRGIYETVDAVDIVLENGKTGHALVASTVGDRETISARLPQSRAELEKLLDHVYYDNLIGGFSRKGFIRETERLFGKANPCDYAMLMVDPHNFKAVNDIFGFVQGDEVLKFIYRTINESFLKPVISARVESDHFIFLVRKKSIDFGQLEKLLSLQWQGKSGSVHLSLGCGIYLIDAPKESVSRMVDWAILAKETADRRESGNIAVFDAAMRQTYVKRAEILSSFPAALQNEEIQVYFQPLVRCTDGKICSAEALARWKHSGKGWISPADFVPLLEKNGLISQMDQYVLEKVYAFQESMQAEGMKCVSVSINLSRQDFYNENLMDDIFRLGNESRLPRGRINYEVTETSMAVMREECAYYLSQFRANGSRILLDDFGMGYSSLGMIGNYPLDIVKIDKAFVDRIAAQPAARSVISAMIETLHNLGFAVVAEGVETKGQSDFLRENQCDYIQGYYYYKPMSGEEFRALMAARQDAIDEQCKAPSPQMEKKVDLVNLKDLIDHSGQFIQVCHPDDYTMVYANAQTLNISGHPDEPYQGKKCYQYMLGLGAPCGHCPMNRMDGKDEKEIETDDGEHVFRLKARFTTWNGERVFIEYGRDVTDTKEVENRYASHIRSILETIPEGQGVFHMDLTADKWISSGGHAENARKMQNMKNVDDLIREIASFVPTREGQEKFFQTFSRDAQLKTYAEKQHQIILETESYYDDRSIRWSRITAQLIDNPNNGHVESILYGVDISGESKHVQELELEQLQTEQEKEKLQKQVKEAMDLYSRADHDRRYDFLTGLYNRLSLYDHLDAVRSGAEEPSSAVLLIDLDDFKQVNDRYGHVAGDECLRAMGKILLKFGIENNITFYRYGGDEFVGLVGGEERDVPALTEKLEREIQQVKIPAGDSAVSLTASIGCARGEADYEKMISKADTAMYSAKHRGKNRVVCSEDFFGGNGLKKD